MSDWLRPDVARSERIGLDEAVYCASKTPGQVAAAVRDAHARGAPALLTRLDPATLDAIDTGTRDLIAYHALSRTAIVGSVPDPVGPARVGIVTAGTSDGAVAMEAKRTLAFHGHDADTIQDVGVAGLWRLLENVDRLRGYPVLIAVAGMEAALVSVLGGLVPGLVIAVPTSNGYGIGAGGRTALEASLSSCAPGVVVVNIDNGYGAACAAIRALRPAG